MFRKLKELSRQIQSIPLLFDKLSQIEKMVDVLPRSHPSSNFTVPIIANELLATKNEYEESIYRQAKTSLHRYRHNFQESLCLYEKIVYQSTDKIDKGNYMTLIVILAKLRVLREFMLEMLFNKSDIFSFYLYLVDNEILRKVLQEVSMVDINKVFLIERVDNEFDSEIRAASSVEIYMSRTNLTVTSPTASFELDIKLRRTVLRVLYSLYTDKHHLYHLS